MKSRSPIRLGLVTTGELQDELLVEALTRLPRIELHAVYDPCHAQCVETARRFEVLPAASLNGLLKRVDGVIVGEVGWLGAYPLLQSIQRARPLLALMPAFQPLADEHLMQLESLVTAQGTLLMPELRHRWARCTLRLRELTATKLGAIDHLQVVCRHQEGGPWPALDWCCNVIQSEPLTLLVDADSNSIELSFRRASRDGAPVKAVLKLDKNPPTDGFPLLQAEAVCRHGRLKVQGETEIEWRTERPVNRESLEADRSSLNVMLDLFGRRLAGGLVPVPDLGDLIRLRRLLRALEISQTEGRAVPLNSATGGSQP